MNSESQVIMIMKNSFDLLQTQNKLWTYFNGTYCATPTSMKLILYMILIHDIDLVPALL